MAGYSSISTACFVYKKRVGKAKTTPSKSPRRKGSISKRGPRVTLPFHRFELFNELWNDMQRAIQNSQVNACQEILEDISHFILKNARKSTDGERDVEIPTAVLVTGVNMPDHEVVFSTLKQILLRSVTPFVVSLSSRDAQNTKSVIQKLVTTLVSDEVNLPKTKYTLPVLVSWYNYHVEQSLLTSPVKKTKLSGSCVCPSIRTKCIATKTSSPKAKRRTSRKILQPVVIILEDFEKFPPAVVQDFIFICSDYVKYLPLVFLFGVSTSIITVHQILQQSCLSKLVIEPFRSQSPTEYLSHLLNEILLNDRFPFKVGSRVLQLLEDTFLYNDLSVKTFLSGLKICIMEYFYSSSLSVLCCPTNKLKERIEGLNDDNLEELRKLMSFRKYVESQPIREQKRLLQDDSYLKSIAYNLLTDLYEHHSSFFWILRVLHVFVKDLPKTPMGRQLRELYSLCLENDVVNLKEFEDCVQLLRLLAKDQLILKLSSAFDILKATDHLSTEKKAIKNLLDCAIHLKENAKLIQTGCDQNQSPQKVIESGKRKRTIAAYEVWREEMIELIIKMVKKYLKAPQHLALHEIIYFNDCKAVKVQMKGNLQNAIQTALSDPWKYLQCDCCYLENTDSLVSSLPDICVCYKLHLECGRWINLYDWLQAFLAVIEPSELTKQPSQEFAKKNSVLIARFVRAVAEMQLLGFVKPTPRKTDHVARLAW